MSLLGAPGDLAATPLAAVLLEALNERALGRRRQELGLVLQPVAREALAERDRVHR